MGVKNCLYYPYFIFKHRDSRNREVFNFGKSWRITMKLSDFGSLKQKLKNKFLNRVISRIIYLKKHLTGNREWKPEFGSLPIKSGGLEARLFMPAFLFFIIGGGLDLNGGIHILPAPSH